MQTLSRLNRTAPGKEDTFVLDFVNEREGIREAFEHFQGKAQKGEDPDPHRPNELQHEVEEFRLFGQADVDAFCEVWFRGRAEAMPGDHQAMKATVERAAAAFRGMGPQEGDLRRRLPEEPPDGSALTEQRYSLGPEHRRPCYGETGNPSRHRRDAQRLWPRQVARRQPFGSASDRGRYTLSRP